MRARTSVGRSRRVVVRGSLMNGNRSRVQSCSSIGKRTATARVCDNTLVNCGHYLTLLESHACLLPAAPIKDQSLPSHRNPIHPF